MLIDRAERIFLRLKIIRLVFMSENYKIPRGTADILPADSYSWQNLEITARKIFNIYNYKEIRTPIFEETGLFARSMGQTSDVVQKQMLNLASQRLDDKGNVQLSGLSLRPENTASVVRSYIQNSLDKKESLSRLFYIGPMFRGERPQKGRLRQFHQLGAEAIGPNSISPYLDAEVIALAVNILKSFGLKKFELKINSLGSPECKQIIHDRLISTISSCVDELCEDCKDRYTRNVFRVLDCKQDVCKRVVKNIGYNNGWLNEEGLKYYEQVKKALDDLDVNYTEEPSLVRGLDYYTHTVFEIVGSSLGSQDALGAGGRYNGLVSQLGGPQVDAIGFALGMERILLAGGERNQIKEKGIDLYFLAIDESTLNDIFKKAEEVRTVCRKLQKNISIGVSYNISSMKSQMRAANKSNAKFVAIYGLDEKKKGVVKLKNMSSSEEQDISSQDFNQKVINIIVETQEQN